MSLEDDIGAQPIQPPTSNLEGDLGLSENSASPENVSAKEPESFGGAIRGEIDAGAALASGALAGTAGSVLRTVNRIIPDWGGTKEELKNKIDSWQDAMTHESSTPEGQYIMHGLGKVVQPIAHGLSKATGAVVGDENVPAVADAIAAIPGLDIAASAPAAVARGVVRGGEAGAAAMRSTVEDANAAGLKVSVGQASGNPLIKGVEALASKLPGGKPLAEVRNMNAQVEHSVSEIQKTIDPNYDTNPHTPRDAGEEIEEGVNKSIQKGKTQTKSALDDMNEAVGGEDAPMAAPRTQAAVKEVTQPTGIPEVDNAVTGAKTKATAKVVTSVSERPKTPTSYSTDGEGAHSVTSPNGETHAVETADGNLKVIRSDTSPIAQGKGEGTDRLETLAHAATGQGKSLISDISVSPAEAAAYEKLSKRGWAIEKNPNSEVNPDTGNTISDSPKNPVYTVKAPRTTNTPGTMGPQTPRGTEGKFEGEWTYNPETHKSEPTVSQPPKNTDIPDKNAANLNPETPWTFKSLRAMRTSVGKALRTATGPQQAQLSSLYGNMSEDLRDFARSKGPDAEQKYEFFNSIAKTNGDQRKILEKAIKNEGGPGEIFRKTMSGSQDDTGKITRVMGAMDEDGKNTFRSVVLHRMGRVTGAQTGPFSADVFLKNWDKMSQEAKNTLFSSKDTVLLRTSLDALTKSLTNMKAEGMLKSGLGTEVQRAGTGISHGVGIIGTLLALKEFGSPIAHLAEGNHLMAGATAASMGAALLANPVMSRVLVNPRLVSWLAQSTKMPKSGLPAMMLQLNQMGKKDKDAQDLETLINQPGEGNKINEGGGLSDDRPITNNHKMVAMKSPSGSTYYGVDPSTL